MPLERLTPDLVREIAAEYPTLSNLNLSRNEIRAIDCDVSALAYVSRLNLSHNQLTQSLEWLRSATALSKLDLAYNDLQHMDQLDALRGLPLLTHLTLEGNFRLDESPNYRVAVATKLPQVTTLDDTPLTAAEKEAAREAREPASVPNQSVKTLTVEPFNETIALLQDRVSALQEVLRLQESHVVAAGPGSAPTYERLLTQWRTKVFELLVAAKRSEALQYTVQQRASSQHLSIESQLAHTTQQNQALEQRLLDARAAIKLHELQTSQLRQEKALTEAKLAKTVTRLQDERAHLRATSHAVLALHQDDGLVKQLEHAFTRLHEYNQRLERLLRTVELASVALQRQYVRLRNQQAAIEADKRVWIKRLQKRPRAADDEPRMQSVRLRNGMEEVLRAAFRRLDPYDTGLVHAAKYLQTIKRDVCVRNTVGGPAVLAQLTQQMETTLRSLYPTSHATVHWTWGEFLLVFLPDLSDAPVPMADVVTVDDVPVSFDETSHDDVIRRPTVDFGVWPRDALEAHARQLEHERAFLVARLQEDARELQGRVVKVQCQWQAKTDDLARALAALKTTMQESETTRVFRETELAQVKAELSQLQTAHADQVRELEAQCSNQRIEWDRRVAEKDALLRKTQSDHLLEMEDLLDQVRTLQKDNAKQELHIRQLERQWARAQDQAEANESAKVESLTRKLEKRDAELMKVRRERNALLATLRDQEKKPRPRSVEIEPPTSRTDSGSERPQPRPPQEAMADAPIATRLEALSSMAKSWLTNDEDDAIFSGPEV
ncbi:hypothetical protein SPRG_04665 [Saprolegnia parasitica CBS 223.65]|uniref:Coiled-coil alpha-helical rod protein 1 n=1 Tax=Saprolegnia parasitica (strain CBS 223.65) TaxID=695850 RepID=A0A067CJ67_SAPPC|nr:hypothetical protein SPRG_04665 [Saprolegnia parasitica CBS 223.65]KDO30764.1 hypothetical protein SPRG_04665 [Saprolegnia parasitica CBS 223.65]|eukprot:XP_012198463.1 hypothetical protein SPRG_04665 [Saprolegnia parasitica CBS 223.65]